MFDAVDSNHMQDIKHKPTGPSTPLQQRVNTLLNFYCNVYDVTADEQQRCCSVKRRPWLVLQLQGVA